VRHATAKAVEIEEPARIVQQRSSDFIERELAGLRLFEDAFAY
jgi:hypothetical protein